ncbi:hypothetical protein BKA65DRAFT_547556 [Rhexocercosporidium sp. MPI-PUGE-AT-0058]|nr:hypothetical protein BKA65DRAFT_547556 [Rhexocercosporidium sp. MPI-PUGE-AT-0058]
MDTQPFSDEEKRFVLAEAIRTSSIPLERLFFFLNDHSQIPSWDDMLVPRGRTLKQCKDVFESLRPSHPAPVFPPHVQNQSQIQSHNLPISSAPSPGIKRKSTSGTLEAFSSGPAPKRRQSSSDPVIPARDRTIRPKPLNGSPLSIAASFPTPEPKKRGRPSKKDVERKQQEAIARGDIIPPGPSMTSYQVSGEEVSVPGYATIRPQPLQYAPGPGTPIERDIPESAGSPGRKRRPKAAPKASKPTSKQPGEGSFKVNPPVSSTIEPEEPHVATTPATSEAVSVAGPIEVASTAPSSFPVAITAPPPSIPIPTQPPSNI